MSVSLYFYRISSSVKWSLPRPTLLVEKWVCVFWTVLVITFDPFSMAIKIFDKDCIILGSNYILWSDTSIVTIS